METKEIISVQSRLTEARLRVATIDTSIGTAKEVKMEIVSILTDASNCSLINQRFPVGCTWLNITPIRNEDNVVTMELMHDIHAFGFLVTKEHQMTKNKIMGDYFMLFGKMNETQKRMILDANSQEEYMTMIGEN